MSKAGMEIPNDGDRINMLSREMATGFERIEKVLTRFDQRLNEQDQIIGRFGKPNYGNWIALGGLLALLAGMGATLVVAFVQPIASAELTLRNDLIRVEQESKAELAAAVTDRNTQIARLDKSLEKIDQRADSLAAESAVARAEREAATRENGLRFDLEASRRDLAVEKARTERRSEIEDIRGDIKILKRIADPFNKEN